MSKEKEKEAAAHEKKATRINKMNTSKSRRSIKKLSELLPDKDKPS